MRVQRWMGLRAKDLFCFWELDGIVCGVYNSPVVKKYQVLFGPISVDVDTLNTRVSTLYPSRSRSRGSAQSRSPARHIAVAQ
jgi:hypothetical protein